MTDTDATTNRQPLMHYIERIEDLDAEKREIAERIKNVYQVASIDGYDQKTMKRMIKLRKLSTAEREEQDALDDLYKAQLGMLNGTPLGIAALKRLQKTPDAPTADESEQSKADDPSALPAPAAGEISQADIEAARAAGAEAAHAGKPVTANPFPARDPRRAAFDEGWCKAIGSDGMDIPDAWRRKKPSKPAAPPPADDDAGTGAAP